MQQVFLFRKENEKEKIVIKCVERRKSDKRTFFYCTFDMQHMHTTMQFSDIKSHFLYAMATLSVSNLLEYFFFMTVSAVSTQFAPIILYFIEIYARNIPFTFQFRIYEIICTHLDISVSDLLCIYIRNANS